jgi:hypothetical protein
MLDSTQITQDSPQETEEQAVTRLEAMTAMEFKVYVHRLRRSAARRGLRLSRSRVRDPKALDYHGFTILSTRTRRVVLGRRPDGFLPDIREVEKFLAQ